MTAKPKTWSLRAWIAVVAFFWLGSVAHAQFPLEHWDVHISGSTIGVGQIIFNPDGSLDGVVLIRPNPKFHGTSTINFGSFGVSGAWSYDPVNPGRVIGYFSGGSEEVPLDVSFSATGNIAGNPSNSRIRMHATSNNGPMFLRGKPFVNQALDASWIARVDKDGVRFIELFQLTPNGSTYDLAGNGPGYELLGIVLISWGNRVAFVVEELHIDKDTGVPQNPGEGNVRAATGRINSQRENARMDAADEDHTHVKMIATETP